MPSRRLSLSTFFGVLITALVFYSAMLWSLHVGNIDTGAHDHGSISTASQHGMASIDDARSSQSDSVAEESPSHNDHCELHHVGIVSVLAPTCLNTAEHRITSRPRPYLSWLSQPPVTPPIA